MCWLPTNWHSSLLLVVVTPKFIFVRSKTRFLWWIITDKLFSFYLLNGIFLLLTIGSTRLCLCVAAHSAAPSCWLCCWKSTHTESPWISHLWGKRRVLRKEGRVCRDWQSLWVTEGELDDIQGWFLQIHDLTALDLKGWSSSWGLLHWQETCGLGMAGCE